VVLWYARARRQLLWLARFFLTTPMAHATPTLHITPSTLSLSNGYARAVVDTAHPQITSLCGAFDGSGKWKSILAADGFRLEREDEDGTVYSSASGAAQQPTVTVLSNTSDLVSVRVDGIVDLVGSPLVRESWQLSLSAGSRSIELRVEGGLLHDAQARAVRHGLYLSTPTSITGLFSQGVVQMKGARPRADFFGTNDTASRVFALGSGGALDLRATHNVSVNTVLLSSSSGHPYWSGVQHVVAGDFAPRDRWCGGWAGQPARSLTRGTAWTSSLTLSPNDRAFPTGDVPAPPSSSASAPPLLGGRDLEALLTGIYGSAVGPLCTFPNRVTPGMHVAQIATTIARPDRGYQGNYNFFDPDNFLSLSALIYSGDPYLQQQARLVIERSGAFLKPNGQLPHHFVNEKPQYTALSGATQTGPNTFWTLAALQYARNSGDIEWLKSYMPTLRKAAAFCFQLIDPAMGLMKAPGSLMIDVFIRANYTADSNAMVVGFLREFAEAEAAVGNASGASALLAQADTVAAAVNKHLWASPSNSMRANGDGGDHYLTQRNPDGTTRDFVDYDANLIALAHGIADPARADKVLSRIDGGRCSAASGGGPQFVSEVYYGKDDTTHGNVGDSWCSMGRIEWFDAHARRRMGGPSHLTAFNSSLGRIQADLLQDVWLHERYDCAGKQQPNRTDAYFEYPSVVAMLLFEVRYGVRLGFARVAVAPWGAPPSWRLRLGNVLIDYAPSSINVSVPGVGLRSHDISGLPPQSAFVVQRCDGSGPTSVSTDDTGTLHFDAPVGVNCTTRAAAAK
jgi:hypothetical protein